MAERYPGYDVLDKWDSPSFDDATREVLTDRLVQVPARRFLTADEWALLEALANHLTGQEATAVPIAPWIDAMLADNGGEGFRRTDEADAATVWRTGLAAIDNEARRRHSQSFTALGQMARERLLRDIQLGSVSDGWTGVAPNRFLVDIVLKTVAGLFYSHPAAWSEIGFGGPASPRGYVRMQLDKHDPWEAVEAK